MLKQISKLIAFIFLLFYMGCSLKKEPIIGFCIDNLNNERWKKDVAYFTESVENSGGKVIVKVADNDENKQYNQAETLIEQNIGVLVIVPVNSDSAAKIVKLAHRNNIRVIAYDRLINNCDLDYYITFDNARVGEIQASFLTRLCPKGNYAIIGGAVTDHNSILLKLGVISVLQPLIDKRDIKLVYDVYVNKWNADEGYKHAQKCLSQTGDSIDAIIAANDALAEGVIKALNEHQKAGKVLVAGQDAELKACRRIIEGVQTVTVYKNIRAIAETAAMSAMKLLDGEEPENAIPLINNKKRIVPTIILSSVQPVYRANIRETVIAEGYIPEEKIFGNE